jgi:hypothetical protein
MAFVVQLTDGTDTVDFMTDGFQLEDGGLQVSPPEEEQSWTDPSEQGGAALVSSRFGNRTISLVHQVGGATRAELKAGVNKINQLLATARQHSLGKTATRVTFKYGWDGASEVDNFEVLTGTLHLPDDVMSVEKMHSKWRGDIFAIKGCELELIVSPYAYGLSPSTDNLIELPLTNRNGSNVTGGLLITPFTDTDDPNLRSGSYVDNYVEIDGDDILGDAPAKVKLVIKGLSSENRVWIGAGEKITAPLLFKVTDPVVELMPGGSFSAVSYAVGRTRPYQAWVRSGIPRTSTERVFRVKLTDVERYGSLKYRVFIDTGNWPYTYLTQTPMQVRVETEAGYALSYGPIVEQYNPGYLSRAMIQDLGVVTLPPFSAKVPSPRDVYLALYMQGASYQDYWFALSSIRLVPTQNGYREIVIPGGADMHTSGNAAHLVDDGWNEITYVTWTGGDASPIAKALYAPIFLTPGKTQRVYVHTGADNLITSSVFKQMQVQVFYSPAYTGAV